MDMHLINAIAKRVGFRKLSSRQSRGGGHPAFKPGRFLQWTSAIALFSFLISDLAYAQKGGAVMLDTIRVQDLRPGGRAQDIRLPGYDYVGSPALSPDGRWVAFDAYKTVRGRAFTPAECWVVRLDGTEPKKLAVGATPRWSPDGERLLFMREDQADPAKDAGIFLIGRDGAAERRVCAGRWPDWCPDGKRIVFAQGGRPGGGAREMCRVYVARSDGTGAREVAEGDCPSWSPDGKRIAYCKREPALGTPYIRVLDIDTEREQILGVGWWRANWSPDSRVLAANGVVGPDSDAEMIRLAADGRGRAPEPLLPGRERGMSPCYSRDGKAVVFVLVRSAQGGPDNAALSGRNSRKSRLSGRTTLFVLPDRA